MAHAVTTLHYLIRKDAGAAKAKQALTAMLRVLGVATVDGPVILEVQMQSPDFEDSVTIAAAELAGCDLIVTRAPQGISWIVRASIDA